MLLLFSSSVRLGCVALSAGGIRHLPSYGNVAPAFSGSFRMEAAVIKIKINL